MDGLGLFDKVIRAVTGNERFGASRDYWVDDSKCKACYECDTQFSVFIRRHHCRICGRVFCGNCTKNSIPPSKDNADQSWLRVCDYCHRIRHRDERPLPLNPHLHAAARPHSLLGSALSAASSSSNRSDESAGSKAAGAKSAPAAGGSKGTTGPSRLAKTLQRSTSMHKSVVGDLTWEVPEPLEDDFGLSYKDKDELYKLELDKREQEMAATAAAATATADPAAAAPGMVQPAGVAVAPVPGQQLLQPVQPPSPVAASAVPAAAPAPAPAAAAASKTGGLMLAGLPANVVELNRVLLQHAAQQRLRALALQLLKAEGVAQPEAWAPVILRLANGAANHLSPSAMNSHGNMDPRYYVKVKRVPDVGRPEESCLVQGVVCKKNVAHRRMRSAIEYPRVLLLAGALEFQRVTTKMTSIQELQDLEREHLRLQVARIDALHPDVLLVERSVARTAQEELLARGVSLVLNIRPELLERMARCMGTKVVPSIEQAAQSTIGFCKAFRVETLAANPSPANPAQAPGAQSAGVSAGGAGPAVPGSGGSSTSVGGGLDLLLQQRGGSLDSGAGAGPGAKAASLPGTNTAAVGVGRQAPITRTLMFFEGCPKQLGCTILLKGGDATQLARVKRVLRFVAYAAYSLRLEGAFLAEALAVAMAPAVEEEVRQAGLEGFRELAASVIQASVERSLSAMPNGVLISVSPHISVWDHSLALEMAGQVEVGGRQGPGPGRAAAAAPLAAAAAEPAQAAPGGGGGGGGFQPPLPLQVMALREQRELRGGSEGGACPAPAPTPSGGALACTMSADMVAAMRGLALAADMPASEAGSSSTLTSAAGSTSVTAAAQALAGAAGTAPPATAAAAAVAPGTAVPGAAPASAPASAVPGAPSSSAPGTVLTATTPAGSSTLPPNPSAAPAPPAPLLVDPLSTAATAASTAPPSEHLPPIQSSSSAGHQQQQLPLPPLLPIATQGLPGAPAGIMPTGFQSPSAVAAAAAAAAMQTGPLALDPLGATAPTSATAAQGAAAAVQETFSDPLRRPDDATAAATAAGAATALPDGSSSGSSAAPAAQQPGAGTEGAAATQQQQQQQVVPDKDQAVAEQSEAAHLAYAVEQQARATAAEQLAALHGTRVYGFQRIFISMSCRNPKKQLLCEKFNIKRIDLYSIPSDLSLVQFMVAAMPNTTKKWACCGDPPLAHVRTILHCTARITLSFATLPASDTLPGEDKMQVWVWVRPKGMGHEARGRVRRTPLSPEASSMSFGQFLQLCFTGEQVEVGGRSLQQDFVRYFGMGRTVMCIYQDRIAPFTMDMPSLLMPYSFHAQLKWLKQESAELCQEADEAFDVVELSLREHPYFTALQQQMAVQQQQQQQQQALASTLAGADSLASAMSVASTTVTATVSLSGSSFTGGAAGPLGAVGAPLPPVPASLATAASCSSAGGVAGVAASEAGMAAGVAPSLAGSSGGAGAGAAPGLGAFVGAAASAGGGAQSLPNMVAAVRKDRSSFEERVAEVVRAAALAQDSPAWDEAVMQGVQDLNRLRRSLAITLLSWAATLQDPQAFAAAFVRATSTAGASAGGAPPGLSASSFEGASFSTMSSSGDYASLFAHSSSAAVQRMGLTAIDEMAEQAQREGSSHSLPVPILPNSAAAGPIAVQAVAEMVARVSAQAQAGGAPGGGAGGPGGLGGGLDLEGPQGVMDMVAGNTGVPGRATPKGTEGVSPAKGEGPAGPHCLLSRQDSEDSEEGGTGVGGLAQGGQQGGQGAAGAPPSAIHTPEGSEMGDGDGVGGDSDDEADRSQFYNWLSHDNIGEPMDEDTEDYYPHLQGAYDELEAVATASAVGVPVTTGAGAGAGSACGSVHGSQAVPQHPMTRTSTVASSIGTVEDSAAGMHAGSARPPVHPAHHPAVSALQQAEGVALGAGAGALPGGVPRTQSSASMGPPADRVRLSVGGDEMRSNSISIPTGPSRAGTDALAVVSGSGPGAAPPEPTSLSTSPKDKASFPRRQLQNVRRKLEELKGAGGGGLGAISRVCLPGRALLPPGINDTIIPVYDSEPTSVIAYFLCSRTYQQMLNATIKDIFKASHAQTPLGQDAWLALLLSREPCHVRMAFEDEAPGMPWARARFQVLAYCAPQFAELRRRLVQGGEAAFTTSLCRCRKWSSSGGKSNAYFAKTRDDRYIVKSLSKTEKQSFLEFAPAYFEHMAKTALGGENTCLAKILGVFNVSLKAGSGALGSAGLAGLGLGKDGSLDLLVMENCFYDRQISRIYDLKGSERNRFNADAAANPQDAKEVHLDDNLRRANASAPLFVEACSLRQMQKALWCDTAFLASLGVMDYSLLVGVDKEDHVLSVAIIDFVRQYTWDKQLETWVKSSGMLGGNGKEPTIVSPKQYCRRFRQAMNSYFTIVPASADMEPDLDPDDCL